MNNYNSMVVKAVCVVIMAILLGLFLKSLYLNQHAVSDVLFCETEAKKVYKVLIR